MTTARRFGQDSDFGAWIRGKKELDSIHAALVVNDIDYSIHKYRTNIDSIGTRDVQLSMNVEVKTRNAEPDSSQRELLFYNHQLLNNKKELKRQGQDPVMVWHFGHFVLSIEGNVPRDGDRMRWGVFKDDGDIRWFRTSKESRIVKIMGFELRPDNPQEPLSLRRHHKTSKVLIVEKTQLGFSIETELRKRS